MIERKKLISYLILLTVLFSMITPIGNINKKASSFTSENQEKIHLAATQSFAKQWIKNPNFTSSANWTSTKGVLGDPTDVNASISEGQANFEVIGKKGRKEISDPINIANSGNWTPFNKTEPAINPDTYTIDNNGFYVSHSWHDATADQFASISWRYNVSMDVDMSEYTITSAFLNSTMYATVNWNIDTPNDVDARTGAAIDQPGIFDHAFFYVEIADMDVINPYRVAYNQTNKLGQDLPTTFYTIDTKSIEPVGDEEDLIYYLNRVFENDPGHDNFTIIVGIEISCEDDYTGTDYDDWDELRIQSLNLTFTYEKKIDQLTSISWNQYGEKPSDISNNTITVNEALLNFKYKINDTWPSVSPNSEIRILINNVPHSETIKLSNATISPQDAKSGGFDVTYLIDEYKNINLSIQVYLADDFELNRTISIAIDNVSLDISYTVFFDDYQTNLQLFLNGDDKTLSPSIILPIGRNLTITVKYTNQTGGHIPGAGIQLTGVGIIENLKEFSNNYSITINVTQQLSRGINYLNIEATKTNYQTKLINPTITVRKINTDIITVSGESSIYIDAGEDTQLEIMLNDTDNEELINGAIVTYTWNLDPIPRVLTENNGIYEGKIENPPEGLYTITISVFAGEDYNFESFEITLIVNQPTIQPGTDLSWLVYVLIGTILGLVTIFIFYQTYFKFPPLVRKMRKLKKKIRKGKKTKPIIVSNREEISNKNFENQKKLLELEIVQLQPDKFKKLNNNSFKKEEEM